ncbi:hypothetical protein [Moorena sp. SIO3I8]|nr:hypothetical protein [Moorena sp. SIO3I8]NEO07438.1 hypothetical protein [Moorena sp. SIO3I8]
MGSVGDGEMGRWGDGEMGSQISFPCCLLLACLLPVASLLACLLPLACC